MLTWFRVYDAELRQWLSSDPLGESGGLNLYGYVGGDPVNSWDSLGLCPFTPSKGGNRKLWLFFHEDGFDIGYRNLGHVGIGWENSDGTISRADGSGYGGLDYSHRSFASPLEAAKGWGSSPNGDRVFVLQFDIKEGHSRALEQYFSSGAAKRDQESSDANQCGNTVANALARTPISSPWWVTPNGLLKHYFGFPTGTTNTRTMHDWRTHTYDNGASLYRKNIIITK